MGSMGIGSMGSMGPMCPTGPMGPMGRMGPMGPGANGTHRVVYFCIGLHKYIFPEKSTHSHGSNEKPQISSGDGLGAEL